MQTLIKVSNKIKWYYIKLTSPLSSFKKWLLTDLIVETKRLDDRVDMLVNQTNIDDVDNRIDNLEYDLEGRIESVEDRSETNQESIKILKDNFTGFHKEYCELNDEVGKRLLEDFKAIKNRFETLEGETSIKKIREIVAEVLCDEGLQLNLLDDRVDNLEELAKKYLNAELQAVVSKQERTEANLSAMQKLSFEICKYYGGDFNLDDFNNCFDIINKYDVKEGK